MATFLCDRLNKHRGFNARSFYGETFGIAFLHFAEKLNNSLKFILLESFEKIDRMNPEFHWEFNLYAMLHVRKHLHHPIIERFFNDRKFKGTMCTNWQLLRYNVEVRLGEPVNNIIDKVEDLLSKMQSPSGSILDQEKERSFTYHCFSMSMLAEIANAISSERLWKYFFKGLAFIRSFILRNGDTLYIGRGQQQLFGYASLIYLLSIAYNKTGDSNIYSDLNRVIDFVKSFQRRDFSFPLVLRKEEGPIPKCIDLSDKKYLGWYAYNNYFDYFCFMGLMLYKAGLILKNSSNILSIIPPRKVYFQDDYFVRKTLFDYDCVFSKSEGSWSNSLFIPYICFRGKSVFPCYGGEQYVKSLYSLQSLPVPYHQRSTLSLRQKSRSWINERGITLLSPLGMMRRNFFLHPDHLEIQSKIFTPLRMVQPFFFRKALHKRNSNTWENADFVFKSNAPLEIHPNGFSPSGSLYGFASNSSNLNIKMYFKKNET